MKIGSIDILKAYLGALELVSSNAFIGTIPIIDGPIPIEYEGLKFTSTGNSTVALAQEGTAPTVDLKYSFNGKTWTQWDYSTISLRNGQTVCFKGQNTAFATSTTDYNKFVMTGSISASGNIMSIIDNGACNTTTIPANYCFCGMFMGCTSLTTAPALPATTLTESCYRIMFNCSGLTSIPSGFLPATTLATNCYRGMFQDCGSLTTVPADLLPATTLTDYCYRSMFYNCVSLTQAPTLPATTLVQECYAYMFGNSTSLNYIKCLATNISATNCTTGWVNRVAATGIFERNTTNNSWTTGANGIPTGWCANASFGGLKFTSTADNSFVKMNVSGTWTPDMKYSLDGINWASWDYTQIDIPNGHWVYMKGNNPNGFNQSNTNYRYFGMGGRIKASGSIMSLIDDGDGTLLTIPTANYYCFTNLFIGCGALLTVPDLPATKIYVRCYNFMFRSCTGLTTIPYDLLPADETLAAMSGAGAYNGMFMGCTALTNSCNINYTVSNSGVQFASMFAGCTSLTNVGTIAITSFAAGTSNMASMFYGCTSLTKAPELLAPTLTQECYYNMFSGCTNLNYIKCLATNISATNCTSGWVKGVAATGTFIKAENVSWSTGANGIPTGWTTKDAFKGLKMKSTNSDTKVSRVDNGTVTSDLKYSLDDGRTWTSMSNNDEVSLPEGQEICFKGNNTSGFNTSTTDYTQIKVITGDATISGNIMSLIDNGACTTTTIPNNYCFFGLFKSSRIKNIPNAGFLPATTLTEGCYQDMFNECTLITGDIPSGFLPATTLQTKCYAAMFYKTRITSIPENLLPATTLASECYRNMFRNTRITTIPAKLLQATTLADSCYYSMFADCILVEDVPLNLLPATSLSYGCYKAMFQGCTGIKNVPYLPATTFSGNGPYVQMFNNCTSITAVPYDLLPATSLTNYCYEKMFMGCTSLQNAPELPATTMKTGCYANMFQGCTSLVVAPELQASTLVSTCYQQLFDGCTNLRYIKCSATSSYTKGAYTKNWVRGVSNLSTCLFHAYQLNGWTTGDSGIPTGWVSTSKNDNYDCMKFTAKGEMGLAITNHGANARSITYKYYTGNTTTSTGTISTDPNNPTVFADGTTVFLYSQTAYNTGSKTYPRWSSSTSNYTTFSKMTGAIYAHGSVYSLTVGESGTPGWNILYDSSSYWLFYKLFYGRGALKTPPRLDCGKYTNAGATQRMYSSMFEQCSGLYVAPVLPHTSLSSYCYAYMLKNCSQLVVAPRLNANYLRDYCYANLFRGCSKLGQVICKATNISATDCIKEWLTPVRSNGTLYVDSTMTSASWGVPNDWTVKAA